MRWARFTAGAPNARRWRRRSNAAARVRSGLFHQFNLISHFRNFHPIPASSGEVRCTCGRSGPNTPLACSASVRFELAARCSSWEKGIYNSFNALATKSVTQSNGPAGVKSFQSSSAIDSAAYSLQARNKKNHRSTGSTNMPSTIPIKAFVACFGVAVVRLCMRFSVCGWICQRAAQRSAHRPCARV